MIGGWDASCKIALVYDTGDLTDYKSSLVQVAFLVPSGNKTLSEPMLYQIYVTMWQNYDTMN